MSARASKPRQALEAFGLKWRLPEIFSWQGRPLLEKAWDHTVAFFGPQL